MLEVWPVIHIGLPADLIESARLAQKYGAAGVMLISMSGYDDGVDLAAILLRDRFPDLKIGVNYLGIGPREALVRSLGNGYAATWTDRQDVRGHTGAPGHQFFTGVGFKGQPTQANIGRAAAQAVERGQIPVTSGSATGIAPSIEKLSGIREWLQPGMPLGLASGATPDNIRSFEPFLTHVLVATGISNSDGVFDEAKLAAFMRAIPGQNIPAGLAGPSGTA